MHLSSNKLFASIFSHFVHVFSILEYAYRIKNMLLKTIFIVPIIYACVNIAVKCACEPIKFVPQWRTAKALSRQRKITCLT